MCSIATKVLHTKSTEHSSNMVQYCCCYDDAPPAPQRPPVDWSRMPPSAAMYKFPYIVAWSELTAQIHVFNILDQRCVQEIPFPVSGRGHTQCALPYSGKFSLGFNFVIFVMESTKTKIRPRKLWNVSGYFSSIAACVVIIRKVAAITYNTDENKTTKIIFWGS